MNLRLLHARRFVRIRLSAHTDSSYHAQLLVSAGAALSLRISASWLANEPWRTCCGSWYRSDLQAPAGVSPSRLAICAFWLPGRAQPVSGYRATPPPVKLLMIRARIPHIGTRSPLDCFRPRMAVIAVVWCTYLIASAAHSVGASKRKAVQS